MFEVAEIQDAHKLLAPLLGTELAPLLFGIALVAAGQSSTHYRHVGRADRDGRST